MKRRDADTPRARRLVFAGVAWAGALLVAPVVASLALSPSPAAVRLERGRLPAGVGSSSPSRVDPRLGHIVSVLSGVGAEVRCWSPADWERQTSELARRTHRKPLGPWRAYASGYSRTVDLSPEVCAELRKLADDRGRITSPGSADALAWSLETLAHEAQHVSGLLNEAQAECYGMQSMRAAARLFGRTAAEGRYLTTVYWKHWYAWLGPPYRSSECRNGGRLDLHSSSDAWP